MLLISEKLKKLSAVSNGHIYFIFIGNKNVTSNKELAKEIGLSVSELQEVFELYDCPYIEDDYVIDEEKKIEEIFKTISEMALEKNLKIQRCKDEILLLAGRDITVEVIKKGLYVSTTVFKGLEINNDEYTLHLGSKEEENQVVAISLAEVEEFNHEINRIELKMNNDFTVSIYFCIKLLS